MQNKFFRMIDRVPTLIVFATVNSLIGLTWFIGLLIWQLITQDLSWIQYCINISGLVCLSGLLSYIVWILKQDWDNA